MQTVQAPRLRGQLGQKVLHLRREIRQSTGPRPIGKLVVDPQIAEHLHEMRFPTPEEAADPGRRLFGLVKIVEIALKEPHQPLLVFPLADERF
jgi:hypothetical protein